MANIIPADELLELYATGLFPMPVEGGIGLFSPDPRGILPLDGFHIPHGSRRTLSDPAWEVRIDCAFESVMLGCAERDDTWIDETILASFCALHTEGQAHSVEVWRDGELAGGLYGVRVGAAFFGESMFHRVSGASKVALVHLVRILQAGGFTLLDTQWTTPHLRTFGAIDVARKDYLRQLDRAIRQEALWPAAGKWDPSASDRAPGGFGKGPE